MFRRVEPPAGQISNVLANQPISSVKESKDLFSYLSHHGERSNDPVPICDHSRKHFDWQPCEPTDWRIKPRRPRPVPVEHGQGKRMWERAMHTVLFLRFTLFAYFRTPEMRLRRLSSRDASARQRSRTQRRRRKAQGM